MPPLAYNAERALNSLKSLSESLAAANANGSVATAAFLDFVVAAAEDAPDFDPQPPKMEERTPPWESPDPSLAFFYCLIV